MAHKKKHHGPIPPASQQRRGPSAPRDEAIPEVNKPPDLGAPMQDQDPKRRLGNYTGAGEAAYMQPGGKNDANR